MFDKVRVRNQFLVAAALPANAFVLIALVGLTVVDQPLITLLAGAGAVLTLVVAHLVGKQLDRRLSDAITAMTDLTEVQLPAVIADGPTALTLPAADNDEGPRPDTLAVEIVPDEHEPLPEPETDLAAAVLKLENRSIELLAAQRARTRQSMGGLVADLAGRAEVLLGQQVQCLDWLERSEEDPSRLEHLFKLDHLAARLRRICASVAVLADTKTVPNRSEPATMLDVLRVAMAENRRYNEIVLRSVDDVSVLGGPAHDIAHLISELLSNATEASPEGSPIEVHATALDDRTYQITIIDQGHGIEAAKLDALNQLIADPAERVGMVPTGIGMLVIARLAARLSADVTLTTTDGVGVAAEVHLPATVLSQRPLAPEETGAAPLAKRVRASDNPGPRSGARVSAPRDPAATRARIDSYRKGRRRDPAS